MQATQISLILVVIAVLAEASLAGTYIEQTVTREKSHGQPAVVGKQRIWIAGENIRSELALADKKHTTIVDLKAQQVHLVLEKQKEYVSLSLAEFQRLVTMRLASAGLDDKNAQPQLETTDHKKEIAGYPCQQIRYSQQGRLPIEAQLWVTDQRPEVDFQTWYRLIKAMGLAQSLGHLGNYISQIKGFPMLVQVEQTVFDQRMTSTTEVTQLQKVDIDPNRFQVPAGYTLRKMDPANTPQKTTDTGQ